MISLKAFITILFNYLIYVYLDKFEKLNCSCAYDFRKDLSKTMLLVFYIIVIGRLVYDDIPSSVSYFILLYSILFDVVFISYIYKLKNDKCICNNFSQDVTTTILYYYYTLIFFILLLFIFMTIMFVPSNLFVNKK